MRTATITTRVDPKLKKSLEAVFKPLGLTTSEAINIFLHKAVSHRGLPFPVQHRQPNAESREALEELRSGKGVKSYHSMEEMMADARKEFPDA